MPTDIAPKKRLPVISAIFCIGYKSEEQAVKLEEKLGFTHVSFAQALTQFITGNTVSTEEESAILQSVQEAVADDTLIPDKAAAYIAVKGTINAVDKLADSPAQRSLQTLLSSTKRVVVPPPKQLNTTLLAISGFPTSTAAFNHFKSALPWLNVLGFVFINTPVDSLRNKLLVEDVEPEAVEKRIALYEEYTVSFITDMKSSPKHRDLLTVVSGNLAPTKVWKRVQSVGIKLAKTHCRIVNATVETLVGDNLPLLWDAILDRKARRIVEQAKQRELQKKADLAAMQALDIVEDPRKRRRVQ